MLKIMLLDDHAVVRSGYKRLLNSEPDMGVVAEASSSDEANACVQSTAIDVAVVDLSLRGSSGIEAIRGILARSPRIRILVLSMHCGAGHITQAIRSGAVGYLSKYSEPNEVIEAIRQVAIGKRVFSSDVANALLQETAQSSEPLNNLTPREFEVFRLLVQGDSTSGIAHSMHLSQKTIHNYLSLIRQKLAVESDFQLLHMAAQHGLLDFQQ